ncbi:MAG: SDR family oxidoreductase [Bacteroidota bacterium]
MKILVTGANGLLGQKLIALFADKEGFELLATSKGEKRYSTHASFIHYKSLDITSEKEVSEVMGSFEPEVVINTAAMTNVDQCESEKEACWDLNVKAVEYLVKSCNEAECHLVHLSTDFIFDGEDGPYTEEDKPNPVSYYGESKLAAEKFILENSSSYSILRTVLVYGYTPGMSRSNIVLWARQSLLDGKAIKVVTDQWRTPTLAEDLAFGCFLAAGQKPTGIFNISGKDMMTPYDIALRVGEYFKLDLSNLSATDGSMFSQAAKRPPKTGFDISKARKVLGYEPLGFEEGLKVIEGQLKK